MNEGGNGCNLYLLLNFTNDIALRLSGEWIVGLPMLKLIHIKVAIKLSIDTMEEVEIKGSCNTFWIIVRFKDNCRIFL